MQELRYILRHELCHLKRRDMLFKLVLLAANAMHWFNPIVYLMLRQADEDIELACDSAATDGLERAERAAYSRTLLAAVQSNVRALPATTCFGGTVERFKRRITNVLGAQKKRGLGIVALVLALTLAAGCATSWGERAQASSPFDGTFYQASLIAWDDGMTAGSEYAPFLSETNRFQLSASPSPTLAYTLSHGTVYSFPMRKDGELTQENFDDAWSGEDSVDLRALRENSAALWCRFPLTPMQEAPGSSDEPNLVYLSQQNDGSLFLFFSYCYKDGEAEVRSIRWIYQLEQRDNTIYTSMENYIAAYLERLKKDTMTYYTSENGNYAAKSVEDTVADVRVTGLELGDSLEGLSPDGTVLELWHFNYECKPTNKAGVQITLVGGQELTDDGYLNENWTHYLTVLHYTEGDRIGYQVLYTYISNDGLFYNGCGYDDDTAAYLHDVYTDYAGLDRLKMYIPDLLDETIPDGYGYVNQCEARLVAGDGYCYYVPITAWARSSDAEFWYSRYDTGSYFSVTHLEKNIDAALKEWTRAGYEAERIANHYRIVTHEGMSNTVITLYPLQNDSCYQIETHWLFDGSEEENEWGWNRDRAVEKEAAILQAMTESFTVTVKILLTQDAVDSVSDDTAAHTPDEAEEAPKSDSAPADTAVTRDSIIKTAGSYVDYGGYLWYTAGGKFCRWHEGGSVETLRELPYNDVTDQPAIATLAVEYDQVALRWHIGGATTGTTMLELYGADGKRAMELDGSAPFAISGNTVVKLRSFPPTTGNLLLSTDGGKTWSAIGDADWFYGSVTEDSSGSTSYALADLTIRDGYVYTTAVYDINHEKSDDPLVTRSVRINLTTGALEILD